MRLLLLCPGRGSYRPEHRNSLARPSPTLDALDGFRAELGRPTLRELDAAEWSGRMHVAGENASLLTFGATLADLEALDPKKAQVVAVGGNSMGWYTALAAAGALSLLEAARLVETMGQYQAGNVVGAQFLYPISDGDWRPDPALQAQVRAALEHPEIHPSIHLGGTEVLGCSRAGRKALTELLPALDRGERSFPLQLPLHSAFHTPLMAETAARAQGELADLDLRAPTVPLVDGDGRTWRRWADRQALWSYTLGRQVTRPFDFTATVQAAMGEFAPDAILLPGPGESLGGPTAQALIACGWRGLRDRRDFLEAQSGESPLILSLARPEQRARVT